MQTDPASLMRPRLGRVTQGASLFVLMMGCLVLVGWMADITVCKSVLPGSVTMKPNTAVGFVLAAVALWLLRDQRLAGSRRTWSAAATACAGAVAALGLLTLVEYIAGWDLTIDRWLFREAVLAEPTPAPGRMSPAAALELFVLGAALLSLDWETRRGRRPAQHLAICGVLVGLVALLVRVYGVQAPQTLLSYIAMAPH